DVDHLFGDVDLEVIAGGRVGGGRGACRREFVRRRRVRLAGQLQAVDFLEGDEGIAGAAPEAPVHPGGHVGDRRQLLLQCLDVGSMGTHVQVGVRWGRRRGGRRGWRGRRGGRGGDGGRRRRRRP